jgi:hypothetical protein
MLTETKWIVNCGSGIAPNPEFDTKREAIARYRIEIAIPSYVGPGHRRHASIIKRTVIVEEITPPPLTDD